MSYVTERTSEKIANYGAVGMVATPWWLPSVHDISTWCADLLPIVGFLWLLFQFGLKVYDRFFLHEKEQE